MTGQGRGAGLSRYGPHARGALAYGLGPALGLLSGPILARALGPEGRGQFASIMEPLTLAGAVASIGLPAAAAYFIASGKNQRQVLSKTLTLGLVMGLATYACMVWYAEVVSETQGLPRSIYVAAWSFILVSSFIQILRGYWQGRSAWRRLDIERFGFALLRFGAVVAAALVGAQTAAAFAGASLLAFVFAGAILLSPSLFRADSNPKFKTKELYSYSFAASIGTIAVVANNRLDQILLPVTAPSAELGFYAVAVTVAEVPLIFATLASRNALPLASKGTRMKVIVKDAAPFLLAGLVIAAVLWLAAPVFVPLLFGSNFLASVSSVQVLLVGTVASMVAFVSIALLAGWRKPLVSSAIPVSGLVTTCIGFWLLGDHMSSDTAAIIATVSQIVSAAMGGFLVFLSWRRRSANG